jgi:hypothetical protein
MWGGGNCGPRRGKKQKQKGRERKRKLRRNRAGGEGERTVMLPWLIRLGSVARAFRVGSHVEYWYVCCAKSLTAPVARMPSFMIETAGPSPS